MNLEKIMKKTLLLTVAFSLILGLTIVAKAEGLEKISNPSELKHFNQIVKKDKSLWGVRIKASSTMEKKEMKQEQKKLNSEEKKGEKLEKISSLADVKYFKNIRKVGDALWGIRKEAKNNLVNKIASSSIACVKEAITAKNVSLKEAFGVNSGIVIGTLDTRTTCQIAALDGVDQFAANKLCVNAYQEKIKTANEALKKVRNEAWKTYAVKLNECVKSQTEASATPAVLNLEDGGSVDGVTQL